MNCEWFDFITYKGGDKPSYEKELTSLQNGKMNHYITHRDFCEITSIIDRFFNNKKEEVRC